VTPVGFDKIGLRNRIKPRRPFTSSTYLLGRIEEPGDTHQERERLSGSILESTIDRQESLKTLTEDYKLGRKTEPFGAPIVRTAPTFESGTKAFPDSESWDKVIQEAPEAAQAFSFRRAVKENPMELNDYTTKEMIKEHEGLNLNRYDDTKEKSTIGWGHRIDKNEQQLKSIDETQALKLLDVDYDDHKGWAKEKIPGWEHANADQKAALIDLTFNMGPYWIYKFEKFSEAFENQDYIRAGEELRDSDWYREDVPEWRSEKIIKMIQSGGKK